MMRKLMYVREHLIEAQLVKLCKARGWLCWKLTSPGVRGVPDRLVLRQGCSAEFVEVKAPGEKPTPQQERRHAELRALGFMVSVLDSQDAVRDWVDSRA